MSKVRGECSFCAHVLPMGCALPAKQCADKGYEAPAWRPNYAGLLALKMEADLASAREELAEALPDAQRFRALIRMSEAWPSEWHVGHHKGHPPDAHVVHLTVLGDYFTGATFVEAFDKAIAAMDGEAK